MSNKDEEGVLGAESVAMTDSSSERMAKSAAESRVWWLRIDVSVERLRVWLTEEWCYILLLLSRELSWLRAWLRRTRTKDKKERSATVWWLFLGVCLWVRLQISLSSFLLLSATKCWGGVWKCRECAASLESSVKSISIVLSAERISSTMLLVLSTMAEDSSKWGWLRAWHGWEFTLHTR